MTKSPSAAALRRRATTSQGFRLSESDIAQKSWPSGAPSRAAAACIALMPGATSMVEVAPCRLAALDRLEHRRRHREYAGIAARDDGDVAPFGGQAQRMARALDLVAIVAGMAASGRRAATGDRDRAHSRRCRSPARSPRPPPASSNAPGRGRGRRSTGCPATSWPPPHAGHDDHREIGRVIVGLLRERQDDFVLRRRALDIDRAIEQAGAGQAPRAPWRGCGRAS